MNRPVITIYRTQIKASLSTYLLPINQLWSFTLQDFSTSFTPRGQELVTQ